ncbi:SDR family oxidoreductase [Streptomyces sp. NBC_00377]|uniref:SDR family oxidoreductase n=1 Tax=unclassified Streptomyces TaxID=2593676 RepID=UPI002E24213B|nr:MULTISPECIES: SDR family oxidoreductase [unclassified Streptomyces]
MQDSPLEDRTVVVTGAARGVGAALARELARRGARLALIGHELGALESLAASLPTPALAVGADVTDGDALERAAVLVRSRLGPPSVVVANAGIAQGGPFALTDMASWRRVIDVNVTGSALTASAFLPDLVRTSGYHLQIASLASIAAAPLMSAYCASKAGVEAFAHALRAEVAHQGVAVGIAYLNWTDTDMIRDADRHAVLRALRARMPPPVRSVLPPELVATRLATAVERRRTAVYVPASLRLVQATRAALPAVIMRRSRRALPRLEAAGQLTPTGLLGAGGLADDVEARRRDLPDGG